MWASVEDKGRVLESAYHCDNGKLNSMELIVVAVENVDY